MGVKLAVFRSVTPCRLGDRYQRFGGAYCLHTQGRRLKSKATGSFERCVTINRTTRRHIPERRNLQACARECVYLFNDARSANCALVGCLLGLLFYPEDGNSMPVRNVRKLLPGYSASRRGRRYSPVQFELLIDSGIFFSKGLSQSGQKCSVLRRLSSFIARRWLNKSRLG
jgi:hypothetical protein